MAALATPMGLMAMGAGFEGKKALAMVKPTMAASALKLVILAAVFLPAAVWNGCSRTGPSYYPKKIPERTAMIDMKKEA